MREILATECSYDDVKIDQRIVLKLETLLDAVHSIRTYTERPKYRVWHGMFGLVTEAGELVDAFKKHWFYHKPLDVDNVLEECGDIIWYSELLSDEGYNMTYVATGVNAIAKEFGSSYTECYDRVVKKLRVRYPDGFTKFDAEHRDTLSEMEAFTSND